MKQGRAHVVNFFQHFHPSENYFGSSSLQFDYYLGTDISWHDDTVDKLER